MYSIIKQRAEEEEEEEEEPSLSIRPCVCEIRKILSDTTNY
jgi:hypothetical protein